MVNFSVIDFIWKASLDKHLKDKEKYLKTKKEEKLMGRRK